MRVRRIVLGTEVDPSSFHSWNSPTLELETMQGGVIRPAFLRLKDNEPSLKDPRLTFPLALQASNGVLHTIDRVLIPIDLP